MTAAHTVPLSARGEHQRRLQGAREGALITTAHTVPLSARGEHQRRLQAALITTAPDFTKVLQGDVQPGLQAALGRGLSTAARTPVDGDGASGHARLERAL